ncbi:MAG TPA: ATP-binding protein [Polyangiaceae bacterium]|nr:ATP-binding protein [Polyangiaceae bacterium]
MRLTFRFILLITVLLTSVAASAVAGWRATNQLQQALQRVVEQDMECLLSITHTRRLFRSMVVLERDYILSSSKKERAGFATKMTKLSEELDQQLEKYTRRMPAEDRGALVDIRGAKQRFLEVHTQVQRAAETSQEAALATAKLHSQDPVSWEKVIGGLVSMSETRLSNQVKQTYAVHRTARHTLLAVSGLACLIAVSLGYAIFVGIRRNVQQVVALNTNLEGQVELRTRALGQRERALRLVLDSTGDGILGVHADGTLASEPSAAAQQWFGPVTPGISAAQYLFPEDEEAQQLFRASFEQLLEDVLPWEVCVEQMPRRIRRGELVLDIEYRSISANGAESNEARVLVIARDVTARERSERNEQGVREQQALIAKLLQDKLGFTQFVREAETLIQTLSTTQDPRVARRALHTLKGNVAIYGLASVAKLCHSIEDRLEEHDGLPVAADLADLGALFRAKLESIESFLSSVSKDVLEIRNEEHATLVESLVQRKDYQDILKLVEMWSWYRAQERLMRLKAQTEYVAERLEKAVDIQVEHADVRLPPGYLERVWPTLVHVVRNAVDHGVESPEQRRASGKPEHAVIRLSTYQSVDNIVIEISDDGPGIDREALLRAAERRGLEITDQTSIADLVFTEGLSSRDRVSEISGRGVGLSAVLEACRAEGGRVEIRNQSGQGTAFLFYFRRPRIKTGGLAAQLEKNWSLTPSSLVEHDEPNSAVLRSGPALMSGS